MRKICQAFKPGGYFVSLKDDMSHEKTEPDIMLGHVADFLMSGATSLSIRGFVAESKKEKCIGI